ncbi:hypothetical protein ES703_112319 [subsurface metagenome]
MVVEVMQINAGPLFRAQTVSTDGVRIRDRHGNHPNIFIKAVCEVLHSPYVFALLGAEPDVHIVAVSGIACVPEDESDLVEKSCPVSDAHPQGRAVVPHAADSERTISPVHVIALFTYDNGLIVLFPVLRTRSGDGVGLELIFPLIPVWRTEFDAGQFRPFPACCDWMMVRVNRFEVGDCYFVPAVVGLLFIEQFPEVHERAPAVNTVLDEPFDFRHIRFAVGVVIEGLLEPEDAVKNAKTILAGTGQQFIRHYAFLDEIFLEVVIETE